MSRTNSVQGRRRRTRHGALGCRTGACRLLSVLALVALLGEAMGEKPRPYCETAAVGALLRVDTRGSCRPLMTSLVQHRGELYLLAPSDIAAPVPVVIESRRADGAERAVIRTTPLVWTERHNLALHQVLLPPDARLSNRSPEALALARERTGERREGDSLLAVDGELPPPLWSVVLPRARAESRGWYQDTRRVDAPPGAQLGLGAPLLRGGDNGGLLGLVAAFEDWETPPFAPLPAWAGVIDLGHVDRAFAPPGPPQGSRGAVVVTRVFDTMLEHLIKAATRAPGRRAPTGATAAEVELPEPGFTLDDALRVSRIHAVGPERRAGLTLGDQVLAVDGAPVRSRQEVLDAYLSAGERALELRLNNDLFGEERSVGVRPQSGDALDRAHLAAVGLCVARDRDAGALLVTDVCSPRGSPAPPVAVGNHLLGGLVDFPVVVRQRCDGAGGGHELTTIECGRCETDFAGSRARLLAWLREAADTSFPAWLRVRRDDGWIVRVPREQWQSMADIARANVAGR